MQNNIYTLSICLFYNNWEDSLIPVNDLFVFLKFTTTFNPRCFYNVTRCFVFFISVYFLVPFCVEKKLTYEDNVKPWENFHNANKKKSTDDLTSLHGRGRFVSCTERGAELQKCPPPPLPGHTYTHAHTQTLPWHCCSPSLWFLVFLFLLFQRQHPFWPLWCHELTLSGPSVLGFFFLFFLPTVLRSHISASFPPPPYPLPPKKEKDIYSSFLSLKAGMTVLLCTASPLGLLVLPLQYSSCWNFLHELGFFFLSLLPMSHLRKVRASHQTIKNGACSVLNAQISRLCSTLWEQRVTPISVARVERRPSDLHSAVMEAIWWWGEWAWGGGGLRGEPGQSWGRGRAILIIC